MRNSTSKRLLTLAVLVILVVGLMVPSFAGAAASVTAASGKAITLQQTTVYSAPTSAGTKLGTLYLGTWLTVTGYTSNNWYRVIYNNGEGYVDGGMVNVFFDGNIVVVDPYPASGTYVTNTAVNVYSTASSSGTLLGTLPKSTTVYKIGYIGSWSQIVYGSAKGYVLSSALTYVSSSSPVSPVYPVVPPITPTTPILPSSATHTVSAARLNVRTGPGTKYAKIGVLTAGTAVTKVGSSGNWTEIKYGSGTGYVSSKYIKAISSTPAAPSVTTYVTVYAGPGTGYTAVGTVKVGTLITRIGTSGNWVKITDGTVTGYIENTNLSGNYVVAPISGGVIYTTNQYKVNAPRLNVRYGPGTNYAIICTIDYGTVVTVVDTSGNWAKITVNNVTGYVASAYLTAI